MLALKQSASRAFVLTKSIWGTGTDGRAVGDALAYLTQPRTEADCELPQHPRDLISLRIDLAADMKEYDRNIGGWFGRDGGRSTDILDAGGPMVTWQYGWPGVLLNEAADASPECYAGFIAVSKPSAELGSAAEAIWGYLRGLPDGRLASL